jgi:DNA-binding NarL/FixJ family response regulator
MRAISVVIVDDHPAMRAGVRAVLDAAGDIRVVGEAGSGRDLPLVLQRCAPDLVLMDFHLPGENGLLLCHRLKRTVPAPRVVLYSAYAADWLVAPALLAGADALVAKQAPASVLLRALRDVASRKPGQRPSVQLSPEQQRALDAVAAPEDAGLVGMLVHGATLAEVARRAGRPTADVAADAERILHDLAAAHLAHGPQPEPVAG